jgi:cytochrome c-type biogenesis protein CcmE
MENTPTPKKAIGGRAKFIIGGLLIITAIIYLIISSTLASAQFFLTVDELKSKGSEFVGRDIRISGAVLGDTIYYDREADTLTFTIVHMPGNNNEINAQGGLAAVLHEAVNDPSRQQLTVVSKEPPPDLLRHETQAILTGQLGEDGIFYANELLLRCPTKYEDALPDQMEG